MKKILVLVLVLLLSGCSSLTDPVNEVTTEQIKSVNTNVDEAEITILKAVNDLGVELTKEPETIVQEVTVKVSEYSQCIIGSTNGKVLKNATVIDKPFTNLLEIEYDGDYGRITEPFDKTKLYIECKTIYGE